ncbi:hypothetical protein ET495_16770 [Xylanimonas allomyrinae]|uniref:Uncharacterized protein n=1 Tax=Xylanimonas allomyrinae TaxID=2509459 RepID=A0A4P6EVP8_9MICO|nr:hypothetical protein [Xylanimonas allomyrinae]QAY64577.1 hypothetical protein ET495_16770 [Xylanimonas allomyrinae]
MTDLMLLRPDGVLLWRPDEATVARLGDQGAYAIGSGELCTACLVGSTPRTTLSAHRTTCPECDALAVHVTQLAGLSDPIRAGRHDGVLVLGVDAPEGPRFERIRAARAFRAARLRPVFVQARALGIVRLEESRRLGQPPVELVDVEDLHLRGLIEPGAADRVRRYGEWLQALSPQEHAPRAAVLADVASLGAWLVAHIQREHRKRALRDLDDAIARAKRARRAVTAASARVRQLDVRG